MNGSKRPRKVVEDKGDGWMNVFTGAGVQGRDKREATVWSASGGVTLPDATLMDIYRCDGFAKRVIDLPANDMTRQWFTVDGDSEGLAVKALDDLNARGVFTSALKWSRLYGGSLIVMGVDDGSQDLAQPLNEDGIRKVGFLHVYEKCLVSRSRMYTDPANEKFGQTEVYQVTPVTGSPFSVHESRVLVFDGIDVPSRARADNDGWGDSVIQSMYGRIRGMADAYVSVESIIQEFIIGVFTIDNLQDLIANGQEELVRKRLQLVDLSRHMLRSVLVDKEEDYKRITASVAGLGDLVNKLEQALSAVSGVPVTLLFGQSPAGLQATGASDVRFYYDSIAAQQEQRLRKNAERLIYLVYKSAEGPKPTSGDIESGWAVRFIPLWEPTESEVIEMRSKQSETDERYVNTGVLTPADVALSRFGGDEYSAETTLNEERVKQLSGEETNGAE